MRSPVSSNGLKPRSAASHHRRDRTGRRRTRARRNQATAREHHRGRRRVTPVAHGPDPVRTGCPCREGARGRRIVSVAGYEQDDFATRATRRGGRCFRSAGAYRSRARACSVSLATAEDRRASTTATTGTPGAEADGGGPFECGHRRLWLAEGTVEKQSGTSSPSSFAGDEGRPPPRPRGHRVPPGLRSTRCHTRPATTIGTLALDRIPTRRTPSATSPGNRSGLRCETRALPSGRRRRRVRLAGELDHAARVRMIEQFDRVVSD